MPGVDLDGGLFELYWARRLALAIALSIKGYKMWYMSVLFESVKFSVSMGKILL